MSAFEIFLAIVLVVVAIWGYIRGFVRQLGSFAGLAAGIIVCRIFGDRVAHTISADPGFATIALAYIALFLLSYFAVWAIALLLRRIISAVSLGVVDRLLGAVLKVVLWLFLISLSLNAWSAVNKHYAPSGKTMSMVQAFAPNVIGMAPMLAEMAKSVEAQNQ